MRRIVYSAMFFLAAVYGFLAYQVFWRMQP